MSRTVTVASGLEAAEDRFLNRELSWLDFNLRVLDLACDGELPLLERVRFCSIVSSNLDEFFMVRVAGLERQVAAGVATRSPDGRTPAVALADIRQRVSEMVSRQSTLWTEELAPALAAEGITVIDVDECTPDELAELERRFEGEIFPVLTPLAVGPGQPLPVHLRALRRAWPCACAIPRTTRSDSPGSRCPEAFARFVPAGANGRLVPQEQVIAHFLAWLFPGMEIVEHAFFRVTRDADFDLSDEADDLLEAVELELRQRRFGDVVRVEVSAGVSDGLLEWLEQGLAVRGDQVYPIVGPLDLADLTQIADRNRPELKFEPWIPLTRARLGPAGERFDLFAAIRTGDLLVHLPYDSFTTSVEAFVRTAAVDPGRRRDQDDGVPDVRRLGPDAGADRGRRARQADGLPGRAEGALRRAAEHRMGRADGAGRRARGARLRQPQDPRQDDAGRAPRGLDRCAATRTSAPATTTPSPPGCTRTSACSPTTRRSPPTSPTCSTT